jgi:GYF domain 2
MTELWYYAEGEEARGPLSLPELVPLLSRIADPRRVMVWRHGFEEWKLAAPLRRGSTHSPHEIAGRCA